MCFMDPNRVPRIENRDPRIRENHHRVPDSEKTGSLESENRVPTCPYQVPNIFVKKPGYRFLEDKQYRNENSESVEY